MTFSLPQDTARRAETVPSDNASLAEGATKNAGNPGETPFAGERALRALADWFAQEGSDAKAWHVLKELTQRSLDRVTMDPSARCFTTEDLCLWAGVVYAGDSWKDVRKWWDSRHRRARAALKRAGLEHELVLHTEGGGGRGNMALRSWRLGAEIMAEEDDAGADGPQSERNLLTDVDTSSTQTPSDSTVIYRQAEEAPVVLSNFILKRVFASGEIAVGSWRHTLLRANLAGSSLFLGVLFLAVLGLMALETRSITTRDLGMLVLLGVGGFMWWDKWRPLFYAREDRITPLPEEWLPFAARPAQLERKRTAAQTEVLRLTRYVATCPICGSDLSLASGAPEWKRRTFGRCADAPREHVFSFDPVSLSGHRIEQ